MSLHDGAWWLHNSDRDAGDQQPMALNGEPARLLDLCHDAVKGAAKALAETSRWSLEAPVVLIDTTPNHKAHSVTVGPLSDRLPFPSALSSPELKRWLAMQEGMGSRKAWQICAKGPEREAFLEQWQLAQKEFESGLLLSRDQLVEQIAGSRHGFLHSPRELLFVVVEKAEGKRPQLISMRSNCPAE